MGQIVVGFIAGFATGSCFVYILKVRRAIQSMEMAADYMREYNQRYEDLIGAEKALQEKS
jgi:hypothetical protein